MEAFYEDSVILRSINYKDTKTALDAVRAYLVKNQLILYGGMAIDASLKMKGKEGIYHETKLPDYDFYTPDPLKAATDIGHYLCKQGLPDVSVVNGRHITTRRVRVDGIAVADISYCPPLLYEKIQTITHEGLRFVHPHFQVMDIHRALSYPFESPTQAVIFHRWARDMRRYMTIVETYPICEDEYKIPMREIPINKNLLKNVCLTGFAALSFFQCGKISIPKDEPIQLLSDNFVDFENKETKYFESQFGRINRSIISVVDGETYEVIDNEGEKVGCHMIDGVRVANPQHILLSILVKRYIDQRSSDALRVYCCSAYEQATKLVAKYPPTIDVYGYASLSESYFINRIKEASRVANVSLANKEVPKNSYPKPTECETRITFDYDTSQYYAVSGKETTRFLTKSLVVLGQQDMISDAYTKLRDESCCK
jgi:hypothetical protein